MVTGTTTSASRQVGSRIAVVVKYVAYVALPVHVTLLIVFALTGVRELALFNIWSIAMWIAVWVSNARGHARLASLLLDVEVVAHATHGQVIRVHLAAGAKAQQSQVSERLSPLTVRHEIVAADG